MDGGTRRSGLGATAHLEGDVKGGPNGQEKKTEIFASCRHGSRTRNAPLQARKSKEWQGRKGRQGKEPKTGDCHRPLQGPQEREEGPQEEIIESQQRLETP